MARIYERSGKWYADWTENGRRHRRSIATTQRAAQEWLKRKEVELASGVVLTQAFVPKFGPFAADYLDWYEFEWPASYERLRGIINNHFRHWALTPLDRINVAEVERFKVRRRQEGAKLETIRKEVRALKAMLNRAVDWEILREHPCRNAKPPTGKDSRTPRWYSAEEMQALYAADPEHRWIWQLLAHTGLRLSESLNLRWEQVGEDRLEVISTEEERTKSGKHRVVPLSPAAREALSMLQTQTIGSEYALPRMHLKSLSRSFRKAAQRANVGGNLHCLRHTFCSHLVANGAPLNVVRDLAGHSSITVTEKYAHVRQDQTQQAIATLNF